MSVTRHHADWLSLIEVSGPFLSMPVLMRIFPQGLDQREPEIAKELRLAYEEWLEKPNAPGRHQAWIRFVFNRFLEFPDTLILERQSIPYGMEAHIEEYGEMLRPDYAVIAPSGHASAGRPHLLVQAYPPGQNLDGPIAGKHWKASPATRMTELLHAVDTPLGMITNGEQWMLVYAPRGETSGYASWYAGIWQEEPITLRAFSSLLHARRFFGVAESDTLQALLKESAQDQQEVTDQLGFQVRRAVEVLVQAFDRLDQESGRELLQNIEPKELYDAALTVMMRLVFLFSAEERGMLRLGEPLYDDNYAASTLREQLRETADHHGEEVLERRVDAWARLLATFRAVYGGIAHETLRLPAYGGALFDPDHYPFLEGRPAGSDWRRASAAPPNINNRVVLHLMESLQVLQMKVPGGGLSEARRLSFRSLDIEQIGHVYEGLLDHTAVRATTTVIGLRGAKNNELEIHLERLEQLRTEGETPLVEYIKEETKRSEPAIRRALTEHELSDGHKVLIACGQDVRLCDRIMPFAGLLRRDSFDAPVVILPGSVYVTEGTTRRSTGTHYTPKSLTEPIVRHTLEPLVYEGPAEGWPKDKWKLKSPKDILTLRVCDMTMGSGAFLVQTCRYLAERLVEAWENTEQANPGSFVVTPDGQLSSGDPTERLLPKDPDERLMIARRAVADRCLYGVDINPMAVEMAKLSLWLVTMQKDRPFTFLDHALKCGDSLLGISRLDQIESFSIRSDVKQNTFATANLFCYVEEAANKRRQLESLPSESSWVAEKIRLHAEAEASTEKIRAIADIIIGLELQGFKGKKYANARSREAEHVQWLIQYEANVISQGSMQHGKQSSRLTAYAKEQIGWRRTFHWPLEYPEIVEKGGFDAIVGNPPFLGGRRIRSTLGLQYLQWLTVSLYPGTSGNADLCAFFFRRAFDLLASGGSFGLLATNTISQADTRAVSLDPLLSANGTIVLAEPDANWPGVAGVNISKVWMVKRKWAGVCLLADTVVDKISSYLSPASGVQGHPHRLIANAEIAYVGSFLCGSGFILDQTEARQIRSNLVNQDIVFPYLTGQDVNANINHTASRWAINFFDWPLTRHSNGCWRTASQDMREEWKRTGNMPNDYPDPVAGDYVDCLKIVEQRVKPDRTRRKTDGEYALRTPLPQRWWLYADRRPALYRSIQRLERVLVTAEVSKNIQFAFCPVGQVFSHMLIVFPTDSYAAFGILQSWIHCAWAWEYCSTMRVAGIRYSPTDATETFPFPEEKSVGQIGFDVYEARQKIMLQRGEGLTRLYNRIHDPKETSSDIKFLRKLHVEMDNVVATAYNWTDFDLRHNFYETKQGIRFTISEDARRIVLDRLLALNHERYEEEVKTGLHEKKVARNSGKGKKRKSPSHNEDQHAFFEK
jgi:hypothetical protein